MPEYERGLGEIQDQEKSIELTRLKNENASKRKSSIWNDVKYLLQTKTYLFFSLGFAMTSGLTEIGVTFMPELLRRSFIVLNDQPACKDDLFFVQYEHSMNNDTKMTCTELQNDIRLQETQMDIDCNSCAAEKISLIVGLIGFIGGIGGIVLGIYLYNLTYKQSQRKSGAFVSSFGALLASAACAVLIFYLHEIKSTLIIWLLLCVVFITISLGFGIVVDVSNRVIVPQKRSFAQSFMNFIGAGIGGTIPPYFSGKIIENYMNEQIELLKNLVLQPVDHQKDNNLNFVDQIFKFQYLRADGFLQGIHLCIYCGVLGAVFFMISSLFWAEDEDEKEKSIQS